jgi:hypothetical protein
MSLNIVGEDDLMASFGEDVTSDELPGGFAGLGTTAITAGSTTAITCSLNAYLRPDRLVLGAAAIVDLIRVSDIKVGTISLNVGTLGASANCFARDAVGTRLRAAVTASPSVPPVVTVFNGTPGTVSVEGALFGPVKRA